MGTGSGWVIKDANGPRFYSEADIPCPDTGDWYFLPNREDTDTADMIKADQIKFGGQTPVEKEWLKFMKLFNALFFYFLLRRKFSRLFNSQFVKIQINYRNKLLYITC